MRRQTFFQLDDAGLDFLGEQWSTLAQQYTSSSIEIDHSFKLLVEKYSESSRAYHNLRHVYALLTLSESIKDQLQDQNAVAFAIWFHDAVYNTRKTDNEEQSAKLAVRELTKLDVPPETIISVQDMILATKSHNAVAGPRDVKFFLDLDLSILGAKPEVYLEYSRAIRQEYRWVPGFMYRLKRREILEGFLRRESLYFTEEMENRFESQARLNVEQEIKELSE